MNFQALNNFVLLKKIEKKQPENKIITLTNVDENMPEYIVIDSPADCDIYPNDIVYVNTYDAVRVKIDNQDHYIATLDKLVGRKCGSAN